MATFTNFFTATVYGTATTFDALAGGWQTQDYKQARYMAFPKNGVELTQLSPVQSVGGVNCASMIEVLPQGLNQPSAKYCTESTFTQLATNGA